MATYYFSLKTNDEVVATYKIKGLTKKAAENKLLYKELAIMKELGPFKFDEITSEVHTAFQHRQIYNKLKKQKDDEYIKKFEDALLQASKANLSRLETYIAERDIVQLIDHLRCTLLNAFKAISLDGLNDAKHYRHLQFILVDMYNDVDQLRVVVPQREEQANYLAKVINEIRTLLMIAMENQTDFDCYELFLLFNMFEVYYEYID